MEARRVSNRQVWEEWTRLHLDPESDYQAEMEAFAQGKNTLAQTDLDEVGDVRDKNFLHLMCHLGLDCLSWARLGAHVTGVDFSENSISIATNLAAENNIPADFVCADVYDLPERFAGKFDVVYAEGGILAWLPDVTTFAKNVARCLRPGGIFYLRDSHPFRRVIFPAVRDRHGKLAHYEYFSGESTCIEMRGSYALPRSNKYYQINLWVHGIGEIVSAWCGAGLRIEFLHEFPKVYADIPVVLHAGPGKFEQTSLERLAVPSTFSIRASLR